MDDLDDKSSPAQRGPFSAPIQGPNLKPIDNQEGTDGRNSRTRPDRELKVASSEQALQLAGRAINADGLTVVRVRPARDQIDDGLQRLLGEGCLVR
ncbi:hypothetical protein [Azospirillum argentinense]